MIIELVKAAIIEGIDEYANRILADEKSIVGGHSRSGAAVGSLHIESTGEFSRFIGANVGSSPNDGGLHAFFLDEGNGGKIIRPKRGKALRYSDGTFHPRSRPYKGIHWVQTVASRY